MSLTNQQIVDIRRYMGYSASGTTAIFNAREPVYSITSFMGLSIETKLANLQPEEENTLTIYYLANLYLREADIQTAAANLTVDVAGPFKRNANELAERKALFKELRLGLCQFLGFAPGPNLASNTLQRC